MVVKADFRQEKFSINLEGKEYTAFRFENLHDGEIVYDIKDSSGFFSRSIDPKNPVFRTIANAIEFRHTSH